MGMFDHIKCEMPLPEEPAAPAVEWFQTKFAVWPYLEKYIIKADGSLVKMGYTIEDRSETGSIAGCMTKVYDAALDKTLSGFHGDILFGHYDPATGEDWDYVARFTDGICTRIWCDEYQPPNKKPRQA